MVNRISLASAHSELRLRGIQRALEQEVNRQAKLNATLSSTAIPENVARTHLGVLSGAGHVLAVDMTPDELLAERELRGEARACGLVLPLDQLRSSAGLEDIEVEVILWCLAAETQRSYQTLLAYAQDDWNATLPTVGFLCTDVDATAMVRRRSHVASHSLLRRLRLVEPFGTANGLLRQQLRLGPGVFNFLSGITPAHDAMFRDPGSVDIPAVLCTPTVIPAAMFERHAAALRSGRVRVLAIWGPPDSHREEAVLQLAQLADLTLRRLVARDRDNLKPETVFDALEMASALDACFWLDLDQWQEGTPLETSAHWLGPVLGSSPARVILTGSRPWRPSAILEDCSYTECELPGLDVEGRQESWRALLPPQAPDLSERYHLSAPELRSLARLTTTRMIVDPDASLESIVHSSCSIVTRKRSAHFATFVTPRRGPDRLILHPDLHRQVLEIADFFLLGSQVYEKWGFGGQITGAGGMRALFAGDPGTGKTLAAEVIAYRVGLPLMKVDLARVVSKWVGETEKSLELVFTEAEESHAVLFLDECDALTGKRGEIRQGSDKFANLETAYLLQRLEQFHGLAILATNLRDQMDEAFQRRFQAVLHFPLPAPRERLRIWQLAFPPEAPLAPEIQIEALAPLEMTGSSIVSAACTAALLAANERSSEITLHHVIEGISRQFQRESKLFDRQAWTWLDTARVR